ncbi:MAG: cupin domain-containing protein [Hyphomicrobiaceae bacterium]
MSPASPPALDLAAAEVVALLGLAPHPEGGFYRETFRDSAAVPGSARALSTCIYFLLPEGVISRWHRVDAVETWHWYAGAPLELSITPGLTTTPATTRLGNDLVAGERPQGIVPAHHWQQARSLGAWTLVGCTVAPGFEFAGFELA